MYSPDQLKERLTPEQYEEFMDFLLEYVDRSEGRPVPLQGEIGIAFACGFGAGISMVKNGKIEILL